VALAVTAACGTHTVIRRRIEFQKLVEHNEVAGFMIAVVGVLYAVLMAFVVVVVWQQYNESNSNYGREVSQTADLYFFARSLPPDRQRSVHMLVERYIGEMIDQEWPAMRIAQASPAATATLAELKGEIAEFVPHSDIESDARTHLEDTVQHLFDLRDQRLADNIETLPPVLWAALLVGAGITIGFGYLFGVTNFRVQLIMTGAVSALIAVMFTLLIELDFPFRRDTAISPQRWIELRTALANAQTPPAAGSNAR
jgi:hypothetical protein